MRVLKTLGYLAGSVAIQFVGGLIFGLVIGTTGGSGDGIAAHLWASVVGFILTVLYWQRLAMIAGRTRWDCLHILIPIYGIVWACQVAWQRAA